MTIFLAGVLVGGIVFDVLWRITFKMHNSLEARQREYIAELEQALGIAHDA